jgi:glycosyltransferase involved in cell wall biosynthesis
MPDRSPRLALLAAEFPPLGGGGVIRVTKLVKFLSELGWQITVVACDEPAPAVLDESLLAEIPSNVIVRRIRGPLRSIGAAATPAKAAVGGRRWGRRAIGLVKGVIQGLAFPDRWAGWAMNVSRLSFEDLGQPDVILSSGPPHSVHLAAARLARRYRAPFVMDMRDDWAGNPLFRSRLPWRDPLAARLERFCMRRAAHVVMISDISRDGYIARMPFLRARSTVITNGFDPDDFGSEPLGAGAGDPNRPIDFLHAGSLHGRDDKGPFFQVFGRVVSKANDPRPFRLVFMGSLNAEQLMLAKSSIPPDHIAFEPHVPHLEALNRMRAADVLVVILNAAEGWSGTITGKIFEYLASRRPILFIGPKGAASALLESTGAGVSADPNDAKSTEDAIRHAANMATDPAFSGASDQALARFDRRRQAHVWSEILSRAVKAEGGSA